MRTRKKLIGANLIRQRNKKEMAQKDVATAAGMSQSHYSKIESDHQSASEEQITAVINGHVETQHGGNANSYVVQHNAIELLAAKEEIIALLREQIVAKDALLAARDEALAMLTKKGRTNA